MQRVLTNTSGGIAGALELVTANIANPTELNAIGTAVPDWRLVRTNVAGTDQATLYRLDADTDAVSAPYVMASATAGLRWVAIAGAYLYSGANSMISEFGAALNAFAETNVQNLGSGTSVSSDMVATANNGSSTTHYIDVGINGSTGGAAPFTGTNAGYLYTTDDELDIGALGTSANINFYGGATPTLLGNFTSPTIASGAFTVRYTTAASTSVSGAVIIGNQVTNATNVGIGGGNIYAGGVVGSWASAASFTYLIQKSSTTTTTLGDKDSRLMLLNASTTANAGGEVLLGVIADTNIGRYASIGSNIKSNSAGGAAGDVVISTKAITSDTTLTTRFTVKAAGDVAISSTTASTTSITGGLVIGDQSTAATNVGIGGGAIVTGGNITVAAPATTAQVIVTAVAGQTAQFHIRGNGVASGLLVQHDNSSDALILQQANRGMFLGTNSTTRVTIAAGGDVTFASTTNSTASGNGAMIISGGVGIADAKNFSFGTTTGTIFGTATSQKIGFFNRTPVVQPSSTGETVGVVVGVGAGLQDVSTFTGNVGATAYRVNDIVKHLKNLGLIAA